MIIDLEVPEDLHPETRRLVQDFAAALAAKLHALAAKLHAAEKKYGYSDGWLATEILDTIADRVLRYRPKPKSKPARRRKRRKAKIERTR